MFAISSQKIAKDSQTKTPKHRLSLRMFYLRATNHQVRNFQDFNMFRYYGTQTRGTTTTLNIILWRSLYNLINQKRGHSPFFYLILEVIFSCTRSALLQSILFRDAWNKKVWSLKYNSNVEEIKKKEKKSIIKYIQEIKASHNGELFFNLKIISIFIYIYIYIQFQSNS